MQNIITAPQIGSEEVIKVLLTPGTYPIAYNNKIDELVEQEVFPSRFEAEKWLQTHPIDLEIIYEKGHGLFAVESQALEMGGLTSPYTCSEIVCEDD